MNDKLQNVLADLALKLNTTVPILWQSLRKQALLESIANSIWYFVGIFLLSWLIKKAKGEGKKDSYDTPIYFIFSALFGLIYILSFLIGFSDTLAGFFNPDYAALELLGNALKGTK